MLLFFPFRDKLQFDGDEGINLMKTVLVMRGYPLYDQIWSDQPPLLTYLLVAAFRVFGVEVNVGRLTVISYPLCCFGPASKSCDWFGEIFTHWLEPS
ncbi:MAG: hypothetical protein P8X95_08800 [Anaerolineales bacterium]